MASSSRGSEGADKVDNWELTIDNETPEDLILSWTRDATTINTFGTFVENDRQLLTELIQCVHEGKDTNTTKQKLSVLLGTGEDRKSVVIRARALSRLIAIASGLHPHDIITDSETGNESLHPSVDFQRRLAEALQDDNSVLSYLFKDALEADDEVMTVIFCDRRLFEKYPVPYFNGCDLAAVQEISNLWLSQEFLRGFYYYTVLAPVVNQVEAEQSKVRGTPLKTAEQNSHMTMISEEHLLAATMMLCELLQSRTVKAGARLLEVLFSFLNDETDRFLGYEIVKGLVIPLVGFKNGKFRKCFLGGIENWVPKALCHSDSDQLHGHHGQSITIGPSSAQTDSNLFCWAARRGYFNLIWCIAVGHTIAPPMASHENFHVYATEALTVSCLWKVALWCATRHGQGLVIIELARPLWVKSIDFNDYTGIEGCLPPLHLVSLLGDRSLLRILCMGEVGIESGAHKADYLGKTPLDYAMQFQLTTRNSKEGMQFHVSTNNIKDSIQFQTPINEFKEWSQLHAMPRYSTTMMQFLLIYKGGMPMSTLEPQSCTRELLQMPGAADHLKELNDMYTTQANFVLVGAALIASVTFVGWLQPPLGYTDYFQFTQPSPLAPADTYKQYIAVEGHLSVQLFVAFNALSFFLSIGTMLIGAEATLFVHDNDERTLALMKVRKSIKWMLHFFITSMVCIMAAFICAGLAILPLIQILQWNMIVFLCLGACICFIPLSWIFFFLARDQIVKLKDRIKVIMPFVKNKKPDDFHKSSNDSVKDLGGLLVNEEDKPLLNEEDMKKIKTLQHEIERKLQEGKLKDEEERNFKREEERKLKDENKRKSPEQFYGKPNSPLVESFIKCQIPIKRMPSFRRCERPEFEKPSFFYEGPEYGMSSFNYGRHEYRMPSFSYGRPDIGSSSFNCESAYTIMRNNPTEDAFGEEWRIPLFLKSSRHH